MKRLTSLTSWVPPGGELTLRDHLFYAPHYLLGRRAPWEDAPPEPALARWLEGRPPGRALDAGCGGGRNALALA